MSSSMPTQRWIWQLESHANILAGCCLAILMHSPQTYDWMARLGRRV